jgi:N-acetylmuramoyl-L-alanine amidase
MLVEAHPPQGGNLLRKTLSKILLFTLAFIAPLFAQNLKLEVIYPREDLTITARDSTFVFGNYAPASARIFINGLAAKQYPNNTFLAMAPVQTGRFTFRVVARVDSAANAQPDSLAVERNVYIPHFLVTSPRTPVMIDTSYIFPENDLVLEPGDLLGVALKASPKNSAVFMIEGLPQAWPMAEQPARKQFYWGEAVFGRGRPPRTKAVEGIYTGAYLLQAADTLRNAAIRFYLKDSSGNVFETIAPGRLSVIPKALPRVVRLTSELTIGRTGPGQAYQYFLPAGVRLRVTGRDGEYLRVRLLENETTWIPRANCEALPAGTMPPRSSVEVARAESFADRVRVAIFLSERLPFKIEQRTKPNRLEVVLYGVTSDTDWIRQDGLDPLLGDIRWSQERDEKYRLSIDLNQKQQWGYRAFYEESNLILEIKKTPRFRGGPNRPLQDLLVCVDPGHGPDLGAIGPTGLSESAATPMLAQEVKAKLEARGARVILTRTAAEGITLAARPKFADVANADLFVSLHFNALPDGVNPFLNHGASAYYFHPQSYALANAILRQLLKSTKLPNFGLYYDNLAVCRVTSMPAVLIEPAFIMHPQEEALILEAAFRRKVVDAIVRGMEEFVRGAKE